MGCGKTGDGFVFILGGPKSPFLRDSEKKEEVHNSGIWGTKKGPFPNVKDSHQDRGESQDTVTGVPSELTDGSVKGNAQATYR